MGSAKETYIIPRLDSGVSLCCRCEQRGIWTMITHRIGPKGTQELRFEHLCEEHAARFAAEQGVHVNGLETG